MKDIKFISYNGKWPNLCSGTLVLNIDGKDYTFRQVLSSGGRIWFSDDWSDSGVEHGHWRLNVIQKNGKFRFDGFDFYGPDDSKRISFTEDEIKFITLLVNENVPEGCCGGCI